MRPIAWLGLSLGLLACGGTDATSPDAPLVVDADPSAVVIATVRVNEYERLHGSVPDLETMRYGNVSALFGDRPDPSPRVVAQTSGTCTLTTYTPIACDPACTADEVCVPGATCEERPTIGSVGTLTFDGLATPLSITPESGSYYVLVPLPDDLFADAAAISITAPGDTYPAIAIDAIGVAPMSAAIVDGEITLTPGQDHVVAWAPSTDATARVRLELRANNMGHGTPLSAIITCDVADLEGEVTVPAAMIDAFPATVRWDGPCPQADCPASLLTRYHRATSPFADGLVELEVGSTYAFGVAHMPE